MSEPTIKNLDVYVYAHDLAVRIHEMTMSLPQFERYEEGSQIRRSSKRVSASIVEGYSLRKHKALYLSYLYRALASNDETQEHLDLLRDTKSLQDPDLFRRLREDADRLSKEPFRFIQAVERQHQAPSYLAQLGEEGAEDAPPAPATPGLSSVNRHPSSRVKGAR